MRNGRAVLAGLLVLSAAVVLATMPAAWAEPLRPGRPPRFNTEAELREYLEKLKIWYHESSRPNRYGKRLFTADDMDSGDGGRHWNDNYDYFD